jgi:hypothetical protein
MLKRLNMMKSYRRIAAVKRPAQMGKDGRQGMISRRTAILTAVGATLAGSVPGLAASDYELLKGLDLDRDGTVSLDEATRAASAVFAMMDRDRDGALTRHKLSGRLSVRELRAADTDHDGTLDKAEYLALVANRFKAADADADGTLTAGELRSRTGRALLRLLR